VRQPPFSICSALSHYATTLAYWRSGEDLLNQVEVEDVVVPDMKADENIEFTGEMPSNIPKGHEVV
jgi:hypothetical protein